MDDTNTFTGAVAKDMIALAEADINRELRVRDMYETATGTLVAGVQTLPITALRFGGVKRIEITESGSQRELEQMAGDAAVDAYYASSSGVPIHYVIDKDVLRLFPTPDSDYSYTLFYWQKVAALSDSNTTNWLLDAHPDVYLYGALVHAEGFRLGDSRIATWKTLYEEGLAKVRAQSVFEGWSGRPFSYNQGGTP